MSRTTRTILGIVAAAVMAFASCDSPVEPTPPAPLAMLWVSPAEGQPWFLRPGRSLRLHVNVMMPDGSTPSSYRMTFSSLDTNVLRVDAAGLVTAVRTGNGGVRVTGEDGATGDWWTEVFGVVDRVIVNHVLDTLVPHMWMNVFAETRSGAGYVPADTITWTSSDTTVVRVLGTSLADASVLGVGPGSAWVAAHADTATATIQFTVRTIAITSLALGTHGTCGLDPAGALFCWGGVPFAGPGYTGMDDGGYPLPSGGAYAAVDFWSSSCTLDTAGRGSCGSSWPTVWSISLTGTVALSRGADHACSLDAAGVVRCAGLNDMGQAGSPGSTCTISLGKGGGSSFACVPSPTAVSGAPAVTRVSAGRTHTCALAATGSVYCWGDNADGQLGDGTTAGRYQARAVTGAGPFVAVAAGDGFTCALDAAGSTWCWGRNDSGQLGTGTTSTSTRPQQVQGGHLFSTLGITRGSHMCALTAAGEAWCWGLNTNLQLGSATAPVGIPSAVPTALRFRSIATGGAHTCGIATDGVAWCWGSNQSGQLGNGGGTDSATPVRVASQP